MARRVLIAILVATPFLAGGLFLALRANPLDLAKKDAVKKYSAQLKSVLEQQKHVLAWTEETPKFTTVTVGGFTFQIPAFKESLPGTSEHGRFEYDHFNLEIFATSGPNLNFKDVTGIGNSELEAYRALFSLDEKTILAAKDQAELKRIVELVQAKNFLVPTFAHQRIVEFDSQYWRGFMLGSVDHGSSGVIFNCCETSAGEIAGKVSFTFMPLDTTAKNLNFEHFMSASRILEKGN